MAGAVFGDLGVSLFVAGAAFSDLGVLLFVAGTVFGDLGMLLFVAGAACGDVGVSLFVAGTVFGGFQAWADLRSISPAGGGVNPMNFKTCSNTKTRFFRDYLKRNGDKVSD